MNQSNTLSLFFIIGMLTIFSYPLVNSTQIDKSSVSKYDLPKVKSCTLCKEVVDIISYEYRVANKTITDIIQVVRDLCKIIGGPFVEKECNIILDSMDNILKWIGSGDNSTLICDKLHYCNATMPYLTQNKNIISRKVLVS